MLAGGSVFSIDQLSAGCKVNLLARGVDRVNVAGGFGVDLKCSEAKIRLSIVRVEG